MKILQTDAIFNYFEKSTLSSTEEFFLVEMGHIEDYLIPIDNSFL